MSGTMINLYNLARNAMDINNEVLPNPYRQPGVDEKWLAEQRSFGESSMMDGYKPLYNMGGYTPTDVAPNRSFAPRVQEKLSQAASAGMEGYNPNGGFSQSPVSGDRSSGVGLGGEMNLGTTPAEPTQNGGGENIEAVQKEIEGGVETTFSIPMLLKYLQQLGSMEPGDNRDPVFQLDTQYKMTNPNYGIQGTPAEQPTARQPIMMGTNLGNMGNI